MEQQEPERPLVKPSEAVAKAEAALKAVEMTGVTDELIANLKEEVAKRKEEQLKRGSVGKQLDAAKPALTQAATLVTKRSQEVAAAEARADQAKTTLQTAYREYLRCLELTQNEPRVPQRQPAEDMVKVATEAATAIEGVMGVVTRLMKLQPGLLTPGEGTGMQRAQNTVSALKKHREHPLSWRATGRVDGRTARDIDSTPGGLWQVEGHTHNWRRGGTQSIKSGEDVGPLNPPGRDANTNEATCDEGWKGTRLGSGLKGALGLMKGLGGQDLSSHTETQNLDQTQLGESDEENKPETKTRMLDSRMRTLHNANDAPHSAEWARTN